MATKKSKVFRVAVEGATTDGRVIERAWIEQMAASYSPNTYTARINCEHIKGMSPTSDFGAFGSVLSLKAEEVEIGGVKKLGLFAEIEPNEALLKLSAAGQKLHTSIEVNPNFAATGKAYLQGLAITDNPASLGTQALEFSAQHGTLKTRKQHPDNLFTAAEEVAFEFVDVEDAPEKTAGLFARVGEMLNRFKTKEGQDQALFADLGKSIEAIAHHVAEQDKTFSDAAKANAEQKAALDKLTTDLAALQTKLDDSPVFSQNVQRPPVTGGDQTLKTDC